MADNFDDVSEADTFSDEDLGIETREHPEVAKTKEEFQAELKPKTKEIAVPVFRKLLDENNLGHFKDEASFVKSYKEMESKFGEMGSKLGSSNERNTILENAIETFFYQAPNGRFELRPEIVNQYVKTNTDGIETKQELKEAATDDFDGTLQKMFDNYVKQKIDPRIAPIETEFKSRQQQFQEQAAQMKVEKEIAELYQKYKAMPEFSENEDEISRIISENPEVSEVKDPFGLAFKMFKNSDKSQVNERRAKNFGEKSKNQPTPVKSKEDLMFDAMDLEGNFIDALSK